MSFDSRAFRNALGSFATGVAVATCVADDGTPTGVTVNSFNSVSLDPPLVLFSLDRRSRAFASFAEAKGFAITILKHDQQGLSELFADPNAEQWAETPYDCWETGAPILTQGLAGFDCQLYASHDGGDHVIFIGRVVRIGQADNGHPLLYYRGSYRHLRPEG